MNYFLDNWVFIASALVSGGLLLWPVIQRGGSAGKLSVQEAVMLMNREKGVLIDVSEAAEFAALHAKPAKNIPFAQLASASSLPKNKQQPVLLMCASGARAGAAAAQLQKLGHTRALAIDGGLRAWQEAGMPVLRAEVATAKA